MTTIGNIIEFFNSLVRMNGGTLTYYSSLQTAYKAAGTGDTIQSKGEILTENVTFTKIKL